MKKRVSEFFIGVALSMFMVIVGCSASSHSAKPLPPTAKTAGIGALAAR